MTGLFATYLQISITCGAVILPLLLARPLLRRMYKAKWRYIIWLVLTVRLLIPFQFSLPADHLPSLLPAQSVQQELVFTAERAALPTEKTEASEGPGHAEGQGGMSYMPSQNTGSQPVRQVVRLPVGNVAAAVWLLGMAGFFAYQFTGCVWFWYKAAWFRKAGKDRQLQDLVDRLCQEQKVPVHVDAVYCPSVKSPMVIGLFRPLLLMPLKEGPLFGVDTEYMLRHELTHCRRGDIWYKLLLVLARGIHWYDPLVHLMAVQAAADIEFSCDEAVMEGHSLEQRRVYSMTLVTALTVKKSYPGALTTQFCGVGRGAKARIANVLDTAPKKRGILSFLAVAVVTVLLGGCIALTDEPARGLANTAGSLITPEETFRTMDKFWWSEDGAHLWARTGNQLQCLDENNQVISETIFYTPHNSKYFDDPERQRVLCCSENSYLTQSGGGVTLVNAALCDLEGNTLRAFPAVSYEQTAKELDRYSWKGHIQQVLFLPEGQMLISSDGLLALYDEKSDSFSLIADYQAARQKGYPVYQSLNYGVQIMFVAGEEVYISARPDYLPGHEEVHAYYLPVRLYRWSLDTGLTLVMDEQAGYHSFFERNGRLLAGRNQSEGDTSQVATVSYWEITGQGAVHLGDLLGDARSMGNADPSYQGDVLLTKDGLFYKTQGDVEWISVYDLAKEKVYTVEQPHQGEDYITILDARRRGEDVRIYYLTGSHSSREKVCHWYDAATQETGLLSGTEVQQISPAGNCMLQYKIGSGGQKIYRLVPLT